MNRNNWRESLIGGRSIPLSSRNHRRGHSFNGLSRDADQKLDLFSKNRHSLSVVSPDESSDVSVKLGRLSLGSVKQVKSGLDDLLSSTDGGKHDYDWLLSPPGTPLVPSSDGNEVQPPAAAPRRSSLSRSVSTTKASRLSVSQSESHNSSRPARSSSVTRPSISSSQYSTYSSNKSSSILNTSSASVSSFIRPSSPVKRSPSIARPSTPSHPTPSSRSSTPSRARPAPTNSVIEKSRPSQNSRPSTPTSRQQIPANLSSGVTRSSSRPATPTRQNPVPSLAASSITSTAAGRVSNGRISSIPSRPSSPGPRVRSQQQPIVPPDFPSDTPPNLRTTLPDRPLSAGRSRPGVVAMKTNPETKGSTSVPRRHSSPMTSRGRITDSSGKARLHSNGHASDAPEPRRVSHPSDSGMRKPVKSASMDNNGFGRSISKKSLDMAIRHMDIRNGNGSARPLAGTTLFPQSIRSAAPKSQPVRSLSTSEPFNNNVNGDISNSRSYTSRGAENGNESNNGRYSAKLSEVDIYESSRYDAILLKEDLKDANWLHSVDDKSDQGSIFDNGFEHLPEPFDLL